MKKLITLLALVAIIGMTTAQAQSPFRGFFKPVKYETLQTNLQGFTGLETKTNTWLFRPAVELSALQLTWNKEFKTFQSSMLTSAGIGISFAHYIDNNGVPYSDYGFNLLVLTDTEIAGVTFSDLYIAGTVSAFQFVSVGAGYNLGLRQFFFLTGIVYNFQY